MADEFPCSLRNAASDREKEMLVERAGHLDPQCAVGRDEPFPAYCFTKFSRECPQQADFQVASPEAGTSKKFTGTEGQAWSERIAHSFNPAGIGRAQQRTEHFGKQMRVLVRVEVRDSNAGTFNFADLRRRFDRDFFRVKASDDGARREILQAITEMSVSIGQSSNVIRRIERNAINENNVTSDAEIRNRR